MWNPTRFTPWASADGLSTVIVARGGAIAPMCAETVGDSRFSDPTKLLYNGNNECMMRVRRPRRTTRLKRTRAHASSARTSSAQTSAEVEISRMLRATKTLRRRALRVGDAARAHPATARTHAVTARTPLMDDAASMDPARTWAVQAMAAEMVGMTRKR